MQVPPFRHGDAAQSLMSAETRQPVSLTRSCQSAASGLRVQRRLTLVAVGAAESRIAGAAEVSGRETPAAAVGAAYIGRDVPHPSLGVVGRHGNRAAVDHCGERRTGGQRGPSQAAGYRQGASSTSTVVGLAVVLELRAGFAFVVIRAAAVEIALPLVALRLVVAGIGTAWVPLDLEWTEEKTGSSLARTSTDTEHGDKIFSYPVG